MLYNGQNIPDADIKSWLQGKTPAEIAQRAAELGLNEQQVQQALQIGGANYSAPEIESQATALGYNFGGTGGALQKGAGPAQPSTTPGQGPGMYIQGKWYDQKTIQDAFRAGFDPAKEAQAAGITDLGQIHDLYAQAQQIAGAGYAPTGAAALQNAFKQYQQYSPNGRHANDYQGWLNSLSPTTRTAMEAGTYSGQLGATDTTDWEPGGIYGPGSAYYGQKGYGSGLGPRGLGNLDGGYAPATTATTATPTAGSGDRQYAGGSNTFNEAGAVAPPPTRPWVSAPPAQAGAGLRAGYTPQQVDNNPWGADMWRTGAGNASNWAADLAKLMQNRAETSRQGVTYGAPQAAPATTVAPDSIAPELLNAGARTFAQGGGVGLMAARYATKVR